jgi:hypothetical protein
MYAFGEHLGGATVSQAVQPHLAARRRISFVMANVSLRGSRWLLPSGFISLQRAMTLELVDQYRSHGTAPAEQAAAQARS